MLKIICTLVDMYPELVMSKADRLEVMGLLLIAYEVKHYRIASPNPIEVIEFRIKEQFLKLKTYSA